MGNKQDFEDIVREASREVLGIVVGLLAKNVDFDTILRILAVKRSDLEEIQKAINFEEEQIAINLAINLAKDAHKLNLTAEIIEEKTGVNKVEFIKYMEEEKTSQYKLTEDCNVSDKRKRPGTTARKFTRLPDDCESQLSKENERAIELLRQHRDLD